MNLAATIELYESALSNGDLNRISEIISVLNNASLEDKRAALPLYEKIGEDLFSISQSVPNYNHRLFLNTIRESAEKAIQQEDEKNKSGLDLVPEKISVNFKKSIVDFYNRHIAIFSHLKDFYLFKLQKGSVLSGVSAYIACCDTSIGMPATSDLKHSEKILKIEKRSIKDFADYAKDNAITNSGIILILTVTPNLNGIDQVIVYLGNCLDQFDESSMIIIKGNDGIITERDLGEEPDRENIFSQIIENSIKIFNNKVLSYEEQKIIKLFFGDSKLVIDYKILNPGASGSSVIEVQGFPIHTGPTKRFVIKIAKIIQSGKGKLIGEMANFKKYVSMAPTTGPAYQAEYKKTDLFEAIEYNYASEDSVKDAKPFAAIIEALLNPKVKEVSSFAGVIKGLVNCELFRHWYTLTPAKKKAGIFYANYLKDEEKFFRVMKEINDPIVDTELVTSIYQNVKGLQLSSYEKICHGDLHSDNFFWDGENVTLIDFGHTGMHHAVIDHSFLEASIRLKHFPRFIPLEELLEYDKAFLEPESFSPDFDLSFIRREKLRELYKAIHLLRVDAMNHVLKKELPLEYFVSIFLITFRQIQYYDLNQLYGLKLANLMATRLNLPG
jgi:hypothetical protein